MTGDEFGFIKFGSRIDVFLPIGTQIDVKIGDVVKAKLTKLGELK
jgi:phosphatidylserine decarboxylase